MSRMRGFVARYPRDRSRCIKIRVMLRRLMIALFARPSKPEDSRDTRQQIAKLNPRQTTPL
jgi:hypothetical protein